LTEIDGLTMRAAADALGLSVSGAKSRVQRGRALLRARLLRCCAVEVDARGRPFAFEGRSHRCGCA
jgi:RNA polymerase sigma-70 factor (ECF subfamily)